MESFTLHQNSTNSGIKIIFGIKQRLYIEVTYFFINVDYIVREREINVNVILEFAY